MRDQIGWYEVEGGPTKDRCQPSLCATTSASGKPSDITDKKHATPQFVTSLPSADRMHDKEEKRGEINALLNDKGDRYRVVST